MAAIEGAAASQSGGNYAYAQGPGPGPAVYPNTQYAPPSANDAGIKECYHCHTTTTPLWRRDPVSHRTLCNACGLYLQQRHAHRPQELIDAENDEPDAQGAPDGPECSHCHTRQTSVWRRNKDGEQVCNACGVYSRLRGKERPLALKRNTIKPRARNPQT
ncbi:GATA zinc finger-domain-containing protein [Mycena epipterygia]|nr:GATA zinc finger-domain-containing protein [Mycena epipterygia]